MPFAASLLLLVVLSPTSIDEVADKVCESKIFERTSLSVQRVPDTARKVQFRKNRPVSQIFWLHSLPSNPSEELKMAWQIKHLLLLLTESIMFCSPWSECNEEA